MERFSFEADTRDGRTTATLTGDVDLATADRLWEELEQRITPASVLTVDCSRVDFLDSTGLRALLRAVQRAAEVGARFELAAPSGAVIRVLKVAGVAELFVIADDPARTAAD